MAPMVELIGTPEHWEHWSSLLHAVRTGATAADEVRGMPIFDQPSVIAGAGAPLEAAAVRQRCTLISGSFFESAPEGGDAYLLKAIIHDWDDDQALTILRNIRSAITPSGKLVILEHVLPEGAPPHPGMLLDLEMMVQTGGRERTASEYANLLSQGGFRQTRVVPTAGPMSIVEAVPA
jgi:hypothetical protein